MACGAQTCKGVILGVENFFQKVLHRLLHQYLFCPPYILPLELVLVLWLALISLMANAEDAET